jgi:lipid-binding SYLF domain-containing protein
MEEMKQRSSKLGIMVLALVTAGLLFASYTPATAAERNQVQGLVDRARVTFSEFMRDSNYSWARDNIDRAKGVLIFPQVIKGGFVFGGSGGTGVFLARDEKTGSWGGPAFYTLGSLTFGLLIGGQAGEVLMLAMTEKAVDSLLSSSFKLGVEATIALGPVGAGAQASADIPNVTADFVTFVKAKGLYAGLNLEGAVIAIRDGLNDAYYGKDVRATDILVNHNVWNRNSAEIREALKCRC